MRSKVTLQLDPGPRNARNSEGAFVTLASGRVLFAYTRYGPASADDDAAAVIVSRHSDDAGRTWSREDQTVIHQEGKLNVMSVSLLRLQNGRIALLNLRKDPGTCMPFIRFSDDEAKTFSKPLSLIPTQGYHVVNNDRMIQLHDGRLIVPVGLHRYRGRAAPAPTPGTAPGNSSAPDAVMASNALIFFYISDDGGQHWFESMGSYYLCFPDGNGLQEPGVLELADGRVWSWCRAGEFGTPGSAGHQWESFSRDRGMTWGDVARSQFRSPCSPLSVKRIPSTGHLLAVWNDHSGRFKLPPAKPASWGRTPLVSAISRDEGLNWMHHQLIEKSPTHGYCYTAIHFVDDAVLLAYCAGGASSKLVLDTLRVRRVPVKEFYAGSEATPPAGATISADERLICFLQEHDLACPLCAYNLRRLTKPQCPECGQRLKLRVVAAQPLVKAWLYMVVALGVCAGPGLFLFVIWLHFGRLNLPHGLPPALGAVITGLCMASVPGLAVVVTMRRRFLRMPRPVQSRTSYVVAGVFLITILMLLKLVGT